MQTTEQNLSKIAIVGLPNTGKSLVFNNLTKKYALVSNYPLTTVEMKTAQCQINNRSCEVIDTPGLHCLYIHSEEELAVRDMLLSEKPDVIIQCIDANRLKQSLVLTADLLELGIPLVISLNAIDETTKKGMWIDSAELSRLLGVPVVESVAITGLGTKELKEAIGRARKGKWGVRYGKIIDNGISAIVSKLPEDCSYKYKLASLILSDDPYLSDYLKEKYGDGLIAELKEEVDIVRRQFRGNLSQMMNNKRIRWVNDVNEKILRRQRISLEGFSQSFARLSRHPVYGVPILLGILFIIFFSVVNVANTVAEWMNQTFWVPVETQINHLVPAGFWNDFLIGDYGFLTFGLSNAILTVLPILGVFFILFDILEDIGYMPNLCVLTKMICEKLGLSGSAIMPITLGFGCKTMATLTTKSLRSYKEKYISIYLIAFALPCAAQMALNMSILGRIGVSAFVIAFSVLGFVEIAAGLILNRIIKSEQKTDFIQALPDVRLPNPKAVLKKTYYKLYWFLKEALPIFLYAAVALFLADKVGLLDAMKNILRPVIIGFLGFPIEMVEVLVLCMAKHEAAAALMIKLVQKGQLNYIQCIVAVTLTTMFVPCLANIVAMIKELGLRVALSMVVIINATAIFIAGILNWVLILTMGT